MDGNLMAATEILLLRHAEKPGEPGAGDGVMPDSRHDAKSLTVRGWQRAGGLASLLAPGPLPARRLPRPDRIHASAFRKGGGHSRRPEQTVLPLAARLGLVVDLRWALHQEEAFGAALAAEAGTVLVCWQHQGLPALARAVAAPQILRELPDGWRWPKTCFDLIWSLRRERPGEAWRLDQHCQELLAGDRTEPFDLPGAAA